MEVSLRKRREADAVSSEAPAQPARRGVARAAIVAMRPQEWIKNLLVFAGFLFSGHFDQADKVFDATITFLAFCAVASAGYLVNDAHDAELDRQHPTKRYRPIAAGELGARTAIVLAVVLLLAGLAGAITQGPIVAGANCGNSAANSDASVPIPCSVVPCLTPDTPTYRATFAAPPRYSM